MKRTTSLFCLIALLAGCSSSTEPSDPANEVSAALTVQTTKPEFIQRSKSLSLSGNVIPWQEASVGAQVTGLRITDVRVNVGDWVEKGEVLATFSQAEVGTQTSELLASLAEAEAQLFEARQNAQRYQALQGTGAASDYEISQVQTAQKSAEARIAALSASLDAQSIRNANTKVLAPDSGIISARNATVGAVAGTGTELFRLIRAGRLEWQAEVTADQLAQISPGLKAQVRSPEQGVAMTSISRLSPSIDPQKRTGFAFAELPPNKGNGPFAAGMYVSGEVLMSPYSAMVLPESAVVIKDGFNLAYAVDNKNRVIERRVTVGPIQDGLVEVTSGLKSDQLVVVQGASFLNDGDLVKVVPYQNSTQAQPESEPSTTSAAN